MSFRFWWVLCEFVDVREDMGVEGQMIMDVLFKESDRPIGIIVQKISSSNSSQAACGINGLIMAPLADSL